MYNLKEGTAEGRMPGAGSVPVPVPHAVHVTRVYESRPATNGCRGCAGLDDGRLCDMLPDDCVQGQAQPGVIYVEQV